MPYRVLVFVHRKEGTTPQEFRDGWEAHCRLLMDLTKPHSPIELIRHYPARADSKIAERAPNKRYSRVESAPLVLLGNAELVTWDAMVECVYQDELHFQQLYAILQTEASDELHASEEAISEPNMLKLVIVGETLVTKEGES